MKLDKAECREKKRRKKKDGMRVTNRSLKTVLMAIAQRARAEDRAEEIVKYDWGKVWDKLPEVKNAKRGNR